jgi:site-specific DNA-methyltransferase (adenine-specific)
MTPFYDRSGITIYCGDCLDAMGQLSDNTVDTVLTDPPYGLEFMGKNWDYGIPGIAYWLDMVYPVLLIGLNVCG